MQLEILPCPTNGFIDLPIRRALFIRSNEKRTEIKLATYAFGNEEMSID